MLDCLVITGMSDRRVALCQIHQGFWTSETSRYRVRTRLYGILVQLAVDLSGRINTSINSGCYFYCFTVHFCSLSFITKLCTHIYY